MTDRGPLVVLTGPPAAGKSVVGKLLAERLGAAFVDTDAEIEAAAGKPVGDIFIDEGEPAFRDLERAEAQRALTTAGAVVALGSGAVTDPGVQQMLAGQPVAYLAAGFAAIARRLGLDRPRVVIPGNPRAGCAACWTSGGRSTSGWPRSRSRPTSWHRRRSPARSPTGSGHTRERWPGERHADPGRRGAAI